MMATVTHAAGRIYDARRFDMVLGQTCIVDLGPGTVGEVRWSADNDEVLSIDDDNGATAKVTATAVGNSTILLLRNGTPLGTLRIGVYVDSAVTVGMSFGNVREVDKP